MTTLEKARADLINQLPQRVRDPLLSGNDAELAMVLGELTELEQASVRTVIHSLAMLSQNFPADLTEDIGAELPDSPNLELQNVKELPEAPDRRFVW